MLKKYFVFLISIIALLGCNDDDDKEQTAVPISSHDAPLGTPLSGRISVASNTAKDNDVNDIRTDEVPNNNVDTAQTLPNPVILGGYVNRPNAGPSGNSKIAGDIDDFFVVDLRAGQIVSLFVANEDLAGNDLDLALLNRNGAILNASVGEGATESLVVPTNDRYFIQVRAFLGASNYILSVGQVTSVQSMGMHLSDEFILGEAIVQFESDNALQAQATLAASGMQLLSQDTTRRALLTFEPEYTLHALAADSLSFADDTLRSKYETLMAIKQLRQQPGIKASHPNYIWQAFRTPNDELFRHQWNLSLMSLPQAWDTTVGDSAAIIAVVDTGILLNHPDLESKIVQGYDFIRNPNVALDGNSIDRDPSDPGDQSPNGSTFHGTHVAGIVAARTSNRYGIAGIGWQTKVMPLRVLGKGGAGSDYDIEQAIRFAAGLPNDSGTLPARRADVINLSLGGPAVTPGFQALMDEVRQAGIIVVAAAGNDGTRSFTYPASLEGVVSVSAVNINRKRASYSNYGPKVDVAAPGGGNTSDVNGDGLPDSILSTVGSEIGVSSNNKQEIVFKFGYSVGTSMAAPHVAGVISLMKAVNPQLTPADFDNLLASGKITDDLGQKGRDDHFGFGLINANKAVLSAIELGSGTIPLSEPQLVVNPTALNFGLSNTQATLTLSNGGGGQLQITGISENSGGILTIEGRGLGDYLVTVNRGRLNTGTFSATITVTTNSTKTPRVKIPVILQVGNPAITGDAGLHYVLLVDPDSLEAIQETRATAVNGVYHFGFDNVKQGNYIIIAGSDINHDQFICDLGEACGAYLTLDRPTTVEFKGTAINTINFNTGFNVNFSARSLMQSNGTRVGFARPRSQHAFKK